MMQTASFGLSGRHSFVRAEYAGTGLQFVNANVVAIVRHIGGQWLTAKLVRAPDNVRRYSDPHAYLDVECRARRLSDGLPRYCNYILFSEVS
jgi:hypothetical protein